MTDVVEKLAGITQLRDRDVLDVALAGALRDLVQPDAVAVLRRVGIDGDERWTLRAQIGRHDAAATSDPAWIDMATLPRAADHPLRDHALRGRDAVLHGGGAHSEPCVAVFPLPADSGASAVVEISTGAPLDAAAQRVVSGVLSVYRNFQSLLDYSERDTLTGLRNRKTFEDTFVKLVGEAVAGPDGGTWLGVIDIDHFKRVNDIHGHLIGDEVLLLLSRLMRNNFRYNDRVFRFGGEEFVVMMRCAREVQTANAFERLRERVEAFAFPRVGHKTISIGYTEVRPTDSPNDAFQRADRAVYWAKEHGRNRVCNFAELVRAGELSERQMPAGG